MEVPLLEQNALNTVSPAVLHWTNLSWLWNI